jgi:kynurenine formamidase
MQNRICFALLAAIAACTRSPESSSATLDPSRFQLVDLTHSFNAQTIYWPTSTATFQSLPSRLNTGRSPKARSCCSVRGGAKHWPGRLAYLGDSTPGVASKLNFPSFGAGAARLLVEQRRGAALGADVASIDGGSSTEFLVHRIAGATNVPGFENLTNLDQLPPTGADVIALPMKIEGGSGGPLRAIAMVPR